MSQLTRKLPNSRRRIFTAFTLIFSLLNLGFANSSAHANSACTYPNFDGCTLANMTFENKDFSGASFRGANLIGARFKNTKLDNAQFGSSASPITKLNSASFENVSLGGAVFENVTLADVRSSGIDGEAMFPENWVIANGYIVGPKAHLEGANLDNTDLSGLDLREIFAPSASFVGANLSSVHFLNASLNGANFNGANLRETYFVGSNLYLADFGTAELDNTIFGVGNIGDAKLGQAQIKSISSSGLLGVPASLPDGWLFRAGCIIGPNARIVRNCDLSEQDLSGLRSGTVEMDQGFAERLPKGWTLVNASLNSRGKFDGYLIGPGADLQQADLSSFDLKRVTSGPYRGNPTMPQAWQFRNGYFIGPGVNLESVDLASKNMTGASLRSASLRKADLSSSDFRGASIVGANLDYADLSNARFDDVWLQNSDLSNSKLDNTNLSQARLDGMRACSIQGVPVLPEGYSVISGNIVGPNLSLVYCDFRNANFNGVNLSYADLSNANLAGADLSGANLTGVRAAGGLSGDKAPKALPPGWQIVNSVLVGPHADLTDRLLNANLGNLDLSSAVLKGAQIRDSSGMVKLPKTWRIFNGVGVGPGADLSGAELNGANLSEVDLRGVKGRLSTKTKTLTLPVGWQLKQGYLIGPGADLTGAYLNGADLSSVDLRGIKGTLKEHENITLPAGWKIWKGTIFGKYADLSNQRIGNADLTGIDMSQATLTGARLTGVIGKPILPNVYTVVDGVLVGPGVNLSDITWIKSSLTNTSLEGATLSGFSIAPELTTGVSLFNALTTDRDISHSFGQGWSVQTDGTIVGSFSASPTPTLSGLAKVGETLRVVPGSWPTGVTFTYQWLRNGGEVTGASQATYPLSAADFDKQISVVLTASKPGYLTISKSSAVTRIEAASLVLAPNPDVSGVSQVGQTLTSKPGTWDNGVNLTYQWLRDGALIPGETKNSLRLTGEDNGKQISVEVTGTKPGYVTVKRTSASVKVEPGVQTLTPTPTISGINKVGQTLTVKPGTMDSGVTVAYQWLLDGQPIAGATNVRFMLGASDLGKQIAVEVTSFKSGFVTVTKPSTALLVEAGTMAATTPKISGTAKVGVTLKASSSSWVKGSKVTYKWLVNGAAIKGATSSSLKLTAAMKGKKITVAVTQTAPGYKTLSKTSAALTVK